MNSNEGYSALRRLLMARSSLRRYLDVEAAAEIIKHNVQRSGPNKYILACAIIIASIGLNVNSIPVIIGAMLISPLMGPIMGVGLALGTNDTQLLRSALRSWGIMVAISVCASTLYFILSPLRLDNPTELLARTKPTIYDVLIALFGGFAGILETCRKEKGTVISGVAIATALMPPLCTFGYGLANLNLHYALGALYLFIINSIFIALATYIGTIYFGFKEVECRDHAQRMRQKRNITIGLIIIIIPSIFSAVTVIRQSNFERSVSALVKSSKILGPNYIFGHEENYDDRPYLVELYLNEEPGDSDKETLYSLAEKEGIERGQIIFNTEGSSIKGNQLLHDMYVANNSQLRAKDSVINVLQKELKSYKEKGVPYRQIAEELQAQYPTLSEVAVTRGYSTSEGAVDEVDIIVVLKQKEPLTNEELSKIEKWLQVRLPESRCRIIVAQ